jgi:hypothetical protein
MSRPTYAQRLYLVPVTLQQARTVVSSHHRHLGPPSGHRICIGYHPRPAPCLRRHRRTARGTHLDDGYTAEITRLPIDTGHRRYAQRLLRLVGAAYAVSVLWVTDAWSPSPTGVPTSGISLRAAGLRPTATLAAQPGWSRPSGSAQTAAPATFTASGGRSAQGPPSRLGYPRTR